MILNIIKIIPKSIGILPMRLAEQATGTKSPVCFIMRFLTGASIFSNRIGFEHTNRFFLSEHIGTLSISCRRFSKAKRPSVNFKTKRSLNASISDNVTELILSVFPKYFNRFNKRAL